MTTAKGRRLKIFISSFLILVCVIFGLFFFVKNFILFDKKSAEHCYGRDKKHLSIVVDFMKTSEYGFISVEKSDIEEGVMFTGAYTREQRIEDESVLSAFKHLLKNKRYKSIKKSGNTVYFEKWVFIEKDRGIAFPLTDGELPSVEFQVNAEPLGDRGWYYVETDYEGWRNTQ